MRILITGACGFVAQGLVAELAVQGADLVLADLRAGSSPGEWQPGDLTDPHYRAQLTDRPFDQVYHLASLPGALAEREPARGRQINLLATEALFEALAGTSRGARVIFASSIAVYGRLGPEASEDSRPQPSLAYGAHKWMGEILLADHARRGTLNGISLRLPGIVARPSSETGHGSAFMSQIFHAAVGRAAYDLPVTRAARCWWMSRATCVSNLLHASAIDTTDLPLDRTVQLPVLSAPVGDILHALDRVHGTGATAAIIERPNPEIEALFGRLPSLTTPRALASGFVADGDAEGLVEAVARG